jgi:hypothetical protein
VRIAFLSESDVDEAALAEFCAAVVGRKVERVPCSARVRRGWPALKTTLGPALRSLKLSDAELVVVCADGDGTDPNQPGDRRAQLEHIVVQAGMAARVVVALAVPMIEAWWLAPSNPELHEQGWFGRRDRNPGYDKLDLKRRLYGTDRPLRTDMMRVMPDAARAAAAHHRSLGTRFPLGLGPLLRRLEELRRP